MIFVLLILNILRSKNSEVVLFTASNCHECSSAEKSFNSLRIKYLSSDQFIKFIQIDCTRNETCLKNKIRSVPTIRYYINSTYFFSFHGEETTNGLDKFVIDNANRKSNYLNKKIEKTNDDNFAKLFEKIDSALFIMLFVPESIAYKQHPTLLNFADLEKFFKKESQIQFFKFYCSKNEEYCKTRQIKKPTMILYYHKVEIKKFDEQSKNELIVDITHILTSFPLPGTPNYNPTITISKHKSNVNMLNSRRMLLLIFAEKCVHCRTFLPHWESMSIKISETYPGLIFGKVNCNTDLEICEFLKINKVPSILFLEEGLVKDILQVHADQKSLVKFIEKNITPNSDL